MCSRFSSDSTTTSNPKESVVEEEEEVEGWNMPARMEASW